MKHLEAIKKRREFSLWCIPTYSGHGYRNRNKSLSPPPKPTEFLLSDAKLVSKLSLCQAHNYFQQIIHELLSSHRRNVYHGDLKPENILVNSEKHTVKILPNLTPNVPSYYYAAPEVTLGEEIGNDISAHAVDAWSCGIILYYLLTNGHLPNGSDFPAYIDDTAKHLVLHLLDTDPEQRFTLDDVTDHIWFKKLPDVPTSEEKFNNVLLQIFSRYVNGNINSNSKVFKEVKKNFSALNIEHVEDLHLLTRIFSHPSRLAIWLEEKSQLSTFTCVRIARFIFTL